VTFYCVVVSRRVLRLWISNFTNVLSRRTHWTWTRTKWTRLHHNQSNNNLFINHSLTPWSVTDDRYDIWRKLAPKSTHFYDKLCIIRAPFEDSFIVYPQLFVFGWQHYGDVDRVVSNVALSSLRIHFIVSSCRLSTNISDEYVWIRSTAGKLARKT